ncbi:MAG: hypothetical protein U5L09_06920 [Bacteroidales bacterium]|nr:hypothetical protein [Bacteroidales bacterium]
MLSLLLRGLRFAARRRWVVDRRPALARSRCCAPCWHTASDVVDLAEDREVAADRAAVRRVIEGGLTGLTGAVDLPTSRPSTATRSPSPSTCSAGYGWW